MNKIDVINLTTNIYDDRVEYDWRELPFKDRLKICLAMPLNIKIVFTGKINWNNEVGTKKL